MIKRIDRLLVKAFLPPFILSFFIALFVLIMQTLWNFVDKIMGKGVSIFIILEMIGYLCISLFPLALPIGVLIASVMVFGNLSERYELVAMKSAGVSLLRIMWPTVVLTIGVSLLSLTCSNYLIPIANLKSKTRLLDIKRQKPALSIQEQAFNDDFAGFTLYVGDKSDEGGHLKDVLIYDHTTDKTGKLIMIEAERGQMSSEVDGQALKFTLEDGYYYAESASKGHRTHPFVKMKFERHERTFDLTQFDLEQTDENRHKTHHAMLSLSQLSVAMDSLRVDIDRSVSTQVNHILQTNHQPRIQSRHSDAEDHVIHADLGRLEDVQYPFIEAFTSDDQARLRKIAYKTAKGTANQLNRVELKEISDRKKLTRHRYEYHIKIASAIVCLVFLFIGAPMGAIIRKGGYGYPLIVTILFFMLYMVLTISFKETMKVDGIDPMLAAWIPVWVLLPIGSLLTWMALNNRKVNLIGPIKRLFKKS